MRRIALAAVAFVVSSCALDPNQPEVTIQGPKASLSDTAESIDRPYSDSGTYGRFFAVTEINGKSVRNAISASRSSSYGLGSAFRIVQVSRDVPVSKLTAKVVATHFTGSPFNEMVLRAAGKFVSLEGTVEFEPEAGRSYRVKGLLIKGCPSVWIEDEETRENVAPAYQPVACSN